MSDDTIRLTTAQAIVRFLEAQFIEIDGREWRFCGGGFFSCEGLILNNFLAGGDLREVSRTQLFSNRIELGSLLWSNRLLL